MILGIIIFTASVLGLGYVMYKSNVESKDDNTQELQDDWYISEQQPSYAPEVDESEVANKLNQLMEHLHAYEQYYEQKIWECYNCKQLTEQCMALDKDSEEKLALYEVMKRDVTEFNKYVNIMRPFSQNELHQGWDIALQLKNMRLHNPEQIALFDKCWEEIVPYVIIEKYNHTTLSNDLQYRAELIEQMKLTVIRRKQEYAETHKELLQWEHEYNHINAETLMTHAELATAKLDMEAADHALALMLAENENLQEQTLVNAYAEAAEQALILKQAEAKAADVDMARMKLETAKWDREEDKFEQILREHHQPGDELHPNLPPGVSVVPGNDAHPPPVGGGWWSDFVQWIWSWIS